ncbi:MAG: hypothetical protein ACJASL_004903 [Paraglaciecola sp.]|jgi:hypothetical protein
MLKPDKKELFVNAVQLEGCNEFNVFSAGERDKYTSFLYLEPFTARNQRAFDYDMYSVKLAISPSISPETMVMSLFLLRLNWFRKMAMIYKKQWNYSSHQR